jgi:hypothetical protein
MDRVLRTRYLRRAAETEPRPPMAGAFNS